MGILRALYAGVPFCLMVIATGCSTHTQSDTDAVYPPTDEAQTVEVNEDRPSAWEDRPMETT